MGHEWKIIDNEKYENSLKQNELNLRRISYEKWAQIGISRVRKQKNIVRQSFLWVYRFRYDGNVVELSSTNLMRLKEMGLENGYGWLILDEHKANNSFKEIK